VESLYKSGDFTDTIRWINQGDQVTDPPLADVSKDIVRLFYNNAHNKEFFNDTPFFEYIPTKLLQRPIGNLYKKAPIRLVEKTPANCLRIPFLVNLFPDAKFLYLVRRGEDVVSSLMEGWKNWSNTGSKPWTYTKWHYLVPPGWQDWKGKSLQEICAFQWLESNRIAWKLKQALQREGPCVTRTYWQTS
jgi:hypothetical protein